MARDFVLTGIVVTIALAGCDPVGEGDLAAMPTDHLCQYYQSERAALRGRDVAVRAEVERRGAVNPSDWSAINIGDIHYGMNKCEIEPMGGPPTVDTGAQNAVVGEIETLGYPFASATLTNDKVTAFTRINP
jgi:hypothetical protein